MFKLEVVPAPADGSSLAPGSFDVAAETADGASTVYCGLLQ